jgi:hypothetical protein
VKFGIILTGGAPHEAAERVARGEGLLPNSLNGPLTPSVLAEMLGWIGARRSLDGFDVAAEGVTPATARVRAAAVVEERHAAGAT